MTCTFKYIYKYKFLFRVKKLTIITIRNQIDRDEIKLSNCKYSPFI